MRADICRGIDMYEKDTKTSGKRDLSRYCARESRRVYFKQRSDKGPILRGHRAGKREIPLFREEFLRDGKSCPFDGAATHPGKLIENHAMDIERVCPPL